MEQSGNLNRELNQRPRHISTRPSDEPIFTSPTGMDFEKRRMVVPPGVATQSFGDHMRQTEKTASFTAGTETVILADASGGRIKIILPDADTNAGKWYWIKKIDSSSNLVTVEGDTADETIDGEVSLEMSLQNQYIVIICDGEEWFIIGGEYVKIDDLLRQILSELKEISEAAKETKQEVKSIENLLKFKLLKRIKILRKMRKMKIRVLNRQLIMGLVKA